MKEGAVIRFLVVTLPLGLFVIGLASMFGSHLKKKDAPTDPNEAIRLETAALHRRPVSQADLANSLSMLAGRIGERHLGKPEALESAAFWIESTLGGANMGYVVKRQTFEAHGQEVRNLIAELPGRDRRKEILVIGAHYDTVPGSPGANDNGTGVAALVALARAFAGDPQSRTVRFAAFVNEEPPHFQTDTMGSLVYAKECQARGESVVTMLCLDTIGHFSDAEGSQKVPDGVDGGQFPQTGNFLAIVGDESSRFFVESAASAFRGGSAVPVVGAVLPGSVPEAGWSDHWYFWQAGYPAVMATDTGPFRYPHYHLPTDTPERVDLEKLTEVVCGLEAIVRAWANH